jgi:hypothetical protein
VIGVKPRLDWKGDDVLAKVHDAERAGLEETGEKMVERARSSHPSWRSQTGDAENSITTDPVERTESGARLRFGSTLGRFIFLEIGSRGHAGDHTLRRASDVEGGHLAERIAAKVGS